MKIDPAAMTRAAEALAKMPRNNPTMQKASNMTLKFLFENLGKSINAQNATKSPPPHFEISKKA